ncbi:MAG: citrate/2-methylcitrate synthase, partial [Planctomycetota bacterium]
MTTASSPKPTGLEGLVAGPTAICAVQQEDLVYRGYGVHELAEHATFEEVAYLLLAGEKPSDSELNAFRRELVEARALPEPVRTYLDSAAVMLQTGTTVPMDVLRTAVSLLGNLEPQSQAIGAEAELAKAKTLLARIPTVIGHMQRAADGKQPVDPETGGDPDLGHAANLLYLLTGEKPTEEATRVMDVSLILYAEHDFNASTFTARVIASTLSDLHGAVTGAIAALKGPLHGGANEAAMEMLKEIREAVDAGETVDAWMERAFAEKRKLMGFGHRVYKNGDHRAPILMELGKKLAEAAGGDAPAWFELSEQVQRVMLEKKSIHPNVD